MSTLQRPAWWGGHGPVTDPARPSPARGESREGVEFTYEGGNGDLLLSAREVGTRQVEAVARGEAEFALVVDDPLIVLCYRFDPAIPWAAAPLDWRAPARDGRDGPPAGGEARALLRACLIDAERSGVRALRNVTLSLDFTRALEGAIRERTRVTFDPHAERRALAALRRRHPSAETLLPLACARCLGNP